MAGALYRAAGSAAQSASAATLTPALPSTGSFGNGIYVAVVWSKNNVGHLTATTGWSILGSTTTSGPNFCLSIFTANQGVAAPVITWTGAAACAAQVFYYSDPDGTTPVVGASSLGTGSGNPHTSTEVVTQGSNSLVILIDGCAANTALGIPSGWTSDSSTGLGTAVGHIDEVSKPIAAVGTGSGSTNVTGGAAAWVSWQIEITQANAGYATFAASTKFEGLGVLNTDPTSADATKFEGLAVLNTQQQAAAATKFVGYVILLEYPHNQFDWPNPILPRQPTTFDFPNLIIRQPVAPLPFRNDWELPHGPPRRVPDFIPPYLVPTEKPFVNLWELPQRAPWRVPEFPQQYMRPVSTEIVERGNLTDAYSTSITLLVLLEEHGLLTDRYTVVLPPPVKKKRGIALILDPRPMSPEAWSSMVRPTLLQFGFVPVSMTADTWTTWAAYVRQLPVLAGTQLPDPRGFGDDWRGWAHRFNETLLNLQ